MVLSVSFSLDLQRAESMKRKKIGQKTDSERNFSGMGSETKREAKGETLENEPEFIQNSIGKS